MSTIKKRKVRDGDLERMWTNSTHSMAERKARQLESTSLFLAMENVPTDVVESPYFRDMLKSYDANAEPPSKNKVKDHFRVLEANIRQAQLVTTTGGFVTITCDHWTSVAKQSYCGMTGHWIDEDFKLHACTMGCWLHEGGSTAEDLRDDFLINLFKDCKFDLKKVNIVACVTDTTGNMSKFGRLLEEMGVSHIFCADHVLQLTAKKAYLDSWFNAATNEVTLDDAEMLVLDEVQDLDTMKKARRLVEHFSKSNQQLAKLIEQQKNMDTYNGKQAVGVVIDVVTRWWSTYSMCERLIYLQAALAAMAVDGKLAESIVLNETDWKVIMQVHELLKPFKDAQKLLEGEKYVTLSLLPSAIKAIRNALIQISEAQGEGEAQKRVKNLAKRLLHDFRERWKPDDASQYLEGDEVTRGRLNRQVGLHPLAAFASALDPRTKILKAYSKVDRKKIWAGLQQKAMDHCLLPGGAVELEEQEVANNPNQEEGAPELEPGSKASDLQDFFDLGQESEEDEADEGTLGREQDAVVSIERQIEGEISKYQTLSYLKITSDPLLWWKQKQFQFPILSCLAQKYLCIPATEAPSERIFSTASLLLSKFRNRMDPDLAGRMIFIKKNFEWYEEFLQKASEEE
jgi:hypothetical protein